MHLAVAVNQMHLRRVARLHQRHHPVVLRMGVLRLRLLRGSRRDNRPEELERGLTARAPTPHSARADGQQDFLAERILELLELERGLALVAQHLEHGRPALLRDFHTTIFEMNHVHLQRLDLEVSVIAAMWTGQRHERFPPSPAFDCAGKPDSTVMAGAIRNGKSAKR